MNKYLEKFIGIPFEMDGRDEEGIDCIGLVYKYLHDQGYQVELDPRCSKEWIEKADHKEWLKLVLSYGEKISIKELKPNDIIYFSWKNEIHAGVYVGNGKYIHISKDTTSRISRLNESAKARIAIIMRPSKTQKKTLPPAGRSAMQIVATAVGFVIGGLIGSFGGPAAAGWGAMIGASIGYSMFAPEPGDLGTGDLASKSPKYRFGGLRTTRSNEIPAGIIYGLNRVSGNIIYHRLSDDEKTAYQLIALGEGELNSITDVRINDEPFTDFTGCVYDAYVGTTTQEVDAIATDCYGLRHTASLACTFIASEKLGSLPNKVTAKVEGLKIETWDGSEWTTAKTYSNNPAACIHDYLIRDKEIGGCGISRTNIDEDGFGEVSEYCDVLVSNGESGVEKRFELNYVIDTRRQAIDNLNDMLSSFGGYLIITGTTIKIAVKKPQTSVQSFTDGSDGKPANIKLDSFQYSYIPKDNQINRVGVQYVDINQDDTKPISYVDDFTDQDERGVIEKIFPMYSIGRMSQATRMAWQILYDLKMNPQVITFVSDITAMHIEPGDVSKVTHYLPQWTDKQILVASVQEKENNEYDIQSVSYNSSVYNDAYGSGIMTYDYGSPPNPYGAPPDVTGFEVTSDGINLVFNWTKVSGKMDIAIKGYEIKEGLDWDSGSSIIGIGSDLSTYRTPIRTSGLRTFMIKAKSEYGIYSSATGEDSITITKVSGQNIVLSEYLWQTLNEGTNTLSTDCQEIWTTGYNSDYRRRAIGVKTATTWEDFETAGKTWLELEDYTWSIPTIGTEQTFEFEEIDLGQTHTNVSTMIIALYSGTTSDVTIEWRYGTSPGLAGAYVTFATGEYTYRYVQFKILITCSDTDVPSYLNDLIFRIDAFDVTDRGKDVVVTAPGGATVTFDQSFGATPAIVVTTQGTSVYKPIVTAKSATGFTVKLYDKDDVEVSGVISWISRGWFIL